ncbi:MAG: hypothetical protein HQL50_07260, partial [Magnetococcales bacterium]|nr:hypothetical protein [Magnetococcales bacterium]
MNHSTLRTLATLSLALLPGLADAGDTPPEVTHFAETVLADIASSPIVVAAVKAENAGNKTLDQIKQRDAEWRKTIDLSPTMQKMMSSACGNQL